MSRLALSFLLSAFCANSMVNTVHYSMLLNAHSMCMHQIPRKMLSTLILFRSELHKSILKMCTIHTIHVFKLLLLLSSRNRVILKCRMAWAGAWWILEIQFYRFNSNQFTWINPQRNIMALESLVWAHKPMWHEMKGPSLSDHYEIVAKKTRDRQFSHFRTLQIIRIPMNDINITNNNELFCYG